VTERLLTVARAGALTTVQDRGRPGFAHLGVPRSGALDRHAHRLANRLVGNEQDAPVLETTVDGVAVVFNVGVYAAVTGAYADVSVAGREAAWSMPVHVRAGERFDVGRARRGVRSYLAVSGGISVTPVLGSVSTDLLSGLGPAPLSAGNTVALGDLVGRAAAIDMAPYPMPDDPVTLHIHDGPRLNWLSAQGIRTLTDAQWTVSPQSNRIGLRLDGPLVERARHDELESEGLVLGAVQAPPQGGLVVFGADHPTTGGYPVVAIVDPSSLAACAQASPGTKVRLVRTHSGARPLMA
jgi:biotin-dependent carboxylase-like uncharacterized protein